MEQDDLSLEEGEVSDDSYTPLERPENYSSGGGAPPPSGFPPSSAISGALPQQQQHQQKIDPESSSEEEFLQFSSSSDDSSSDLGAGSNYYNNSRAGPAQRNKKCSKRAKIRLKPLQKLQEPCNSVQEGGAVDINNDDANKSSTKRKKYDIWSTRVQEDVLAETLNSCDVTKKDRSRDVETYDYSLGKSLLARGAMSGANHMECFQDFNSDFRNTNKRSRDDRRNSNLRLVGGTAGWKKSQEPNQRKKLQVKSRNIVDLTVTLESTCEEIATDVANKLCEEKEDLILRVVNSLGKEKTFSLFQETKDIEKDGGMLIMNQTRRRTPGGVFLFLIRHSNDITQEQKNQIFSEDREKSKVQYKAKQREKFRRIKEKLIKTTTQNKNNNTNTDKNSNTASENATLSDQCKKDLDLLTRAELELSKGLSKKQEDGCHINAEYTGKTKVESTTDDESHVINPPPTPETDCHENSAGEDEEGGSSCKMEGLNDFQNYTPLSSIVIQGASQKLRDDSRCQQIDSRCQQIDSVCQQRSDDVRKLPPSYDDDFLDIGCSTNDMDLF